MHQHFPDVVLHRRLLWGIVIGRIKVLRLDPRSAVETYERALAVDNSLSNVWFNLANAHLKLGEEGEAARWYVGRAMILSVRCNACNKL